MAVLDPNKLGRVPVVPLPYSRKELAQGKELIIDYPHGNIYIADEKDPTILYNITDDIITQVGKMNAKNMSMTITLPDGKEYTLNIADLLSFIYNKMITTNTDANEIASIHENLSDLIPAISEDNEGKRYAFITTTDQVYGPNGETVTQRLRAICRLGMVNAFVEATEDNQMSFKIPYPFEEFEAEGNYFEVCIGSVIVTPDRYSVENGVLTFALEEDAVKLGRSVMFRFWFNSATPEANALLVMDGRYIADRSIPTYKLQNLSNAINNPNPYGIATSLAVKSLYDLVMSRMNKVAADVASFVTSTGTGEALVATIPYFTLKDQHVIYLRLHEAIADNATLKVNDKEAYPIYVNNDPVTAGAAAGTILSLCFNENLGRFQLFSDTSKYRIASYNSSYHAAEGENVIGFEIPEFNPSLDKLTVYQNNMRLFQGVNYNLGNNNIQLIDYVTDTNDFFYFEVDRIVPITL